jgi:AcrR family transcriptional regulator
MRRLAPKPSPRGRAAPARESVTAAKPNAKAASKPKPAGRKTVGRDTLGRADWLAAARAMLIREGISAVKVDRLATSLKVTRGGFYWRFKGRGDLLESLLQDWKETNTAHMLAALRGPGTPIQRFHALLDVWIEETVFDPVYDMAVREWGRVSPKVGKLVQRVDDERIEAFRQLFLDAGYGDDEAFIRARIAYYHQIGYYAMGVKETKAQRRKLAELYIHVLTGLP